MSCVMIISIFSITPLFINFTKDKVTFSKVHENKSKDKLKKLLENKDQNLDNEINETALFDDVLICVIWLEN